jgi:ATP synthase protein I
MSDGDEKKDTDRSGISAEDRASIKARAGEIDRRLDESRARITPKPAVDPRARGQAMGQGLKIAVDLVVGVAFGGFVGWWLDRYLGTAPWLMVLLLILGFAAGMMNVIRTARRMQAQAEASQMAAQSVPDDADEDD